MPPNHHEFICAISRVHCFVGWNFSLGWNFYFFASIIFVHYFMAKMLIDSSSSSSPCFSIFSFCGGCVEGLMWGRSQYGAVNFLDFTMYIILAFICASSLNSSVLLNAEFIGTHLHAYVFCSFYLLYVWSFSKSLTLRK